MKIFTQSWHHRLATFYGPIFERRYDREIDFCTYVQAVVKGLFAVLAIIAGCSLLCLPVGGTIAWLAWMTVNLAWVSPGPLALLGICLTVGVTLPALAIPFFKEVVPKIKHRLKFKGPKEHREPKFAFFTIWWYSVKNKVCIPVTLRGTRNEH